MKVYIAVRGENCEGYGILGVYYKKTDAVKCCKEEENESSFVSCDFTEIIESEIE